MRSSVPRCTSCGARTGLHDHRTESNRGRWSAWALPALVLLVLAVTNPSHAAHDHHLKQMSEAKHPVASFFNARSIPVAATEYQSYVIFSVTRYGGEIASWGLLGKVFP